MRLMIVGALSGQISAATKIAMARGAKVTHVDSIAQATQALRSGRGADLLMVDAGLDIAALIAANAAEHIVAPVVACGIDTSPEIAARAIHAGALEFIPLPPDADMIAAILASISHDTSEIVATDPEMKRVLDLADQVAASHASILITGESGVGKEVMARRVHEKSPRRHAPFIAVNCAAIPENLLESELFGHEKGAFTGAIARRIGKFEEAHTGTLLLDEISEMDLRLQAKLLRVLQERLIDRVGGAKPIAVDIRIIATANRDLDQCVRAGEFREDLLYRLNVVNLRVPPLRKRPQDILALANHFIAKFGALNGRPGMQLTEEAGAAICAYGWPGNVRELENAMHRAVLLSATVAIGPEAMLRPDGMPVRTRHEEVADKATQAARTLVGRTVAEVEQDLIIETLQHCMGNRTHAAAILGISIRTLRNKLKQYMDEGIDVPAPAIGTAA